MTALTHYPQGFQGFLDAPRVADLDRLEADIAVLGIPHGVPYRDNTYTYAASSIGMARAVRRETTYNPGYLKHWDFDLGGPLFGGRDVRLVDCGDVPHDPTDVAGSSRLATAAARKIVDSGALPIMIGGDDSVPIPFFRAFADKGPITLVQVDSHIDWRHEVGGITEGYSSTMRRASEMPWFMRMVQIGQRGVGSAREAEVKDALAHGVRFVGARDVHAKGAAWVVDQVPGDRFLVTIDCDGLDPSVIPAVNAPNPGGLSFHQTVDILHGLARKGRIVGFDIVELAPHRDPDGMSAMTVARIVLNMIGAVARNGQLGR
ncbi:MAG: arginase [Alphaproteobacteria bacterium]|nr:arginase [Alphaproteobacteria bacterium]